MVAGVVKGRERRVSLNPRYFGRQELWVLLDKMAAASPELIDRAGTCEAFQRLLDDHDPRS